jgi:urease accessory protein
MFISVVSGYPAVRRRRSERTVFLRRRKNGRQSARPERKYADAWTSRGRARHDAAVPDLPLASAPISTWEAHLQLRFRRDAGRSVLASAQHRGPLRVQRTLPRPGGGCEALILHPPGGIAGGDALHIDVTVQRDAQVLVSTPGASKWYRSAGRGATQQVQLRVEPGAMLDWLPQESVLFRGADASQSLLIDIDASACLTGWDIVQLGRLAAGEAWDRGRLRQTLMLQRNGVPVWREHSDFTADDSLLDSPTGLGGYRVFGTFWACGPAISASPEAALDAVRGVLDRLGPDALLPAGPDSVQSRCCAAATWLAAPAELLVVRALGDDAEALRTCFEAVWSTVRGVLGRDALRPRIWST